MKICPECLERVGDQHDFCPHDGAELREIHAREDDPIEGRVFDEKWVVENRIGGGGMGTVYRGHQLTVDRTVAIKVLRSSLCEDDEHVERFFREAKVASNIDDPRCVTIFDFGQDPDDRMLYLAMEYLEGESLRDRIRRAKLTVREVLSVGIEVCEALETLHDAQVVHRDLKPENIILVDDIGDELFLKVLDFGLAKALDSDETPVTQTGQVYGTPAFMSPEQCMGTEVDPRADLYALGCILYQMISGHTPFAAGASVQTLLAHVNKSPPDLDGPAELPGELERAVMRLLAKAPEDRYPSARRLRERLESIRDGLDADRSLQLPIQTIPPEEGEDDEDSFSMSAAPTRAAEETDQGTSIEVHGSGAAAGSAQEVDPEAPTDAFEGRVSKPKSPDVGGEEGRSEVSATATADRDREDSEGKRSSILIGVAALLAGGLVVFLAVENRPGSDRDAGIAAARDAGEPTDTGTTADPRPRRAVRETRRRSSETARLVRESSLETSILVAAQSGDRADDDAGGEPSSGRAATSASADDSVGTSVERRGERKREADAEERREDTGEMGAFLTKETASRVFQSKNGIVRNCLDGSLGPDAGASAMVELELRVRGDGTVSSVDVVDSRGRPQDVECVVSEADNWSFPRTPTGTPAKLGHRYQFEFHWEPLE